MRRFFALLVGLILIVVAGCDSDNEEIRLGPSGRLYVLNQVDGTLHIYDTETLARTDSLDLGVSNPHYIDFSPNGSHYYIVSLEALGRISEFQAVDDAPTQSTQTPTQTVPSSIAVTSDGRFGYVSNFQGLSAQSPTRILKYDLNSMTLVDVPLLAGAITHDLKITPDGSVVIASNRTSNNVTLVYTNVDSVFNVRIDPDSLYPVPTFKYGPFGVCIDPGGERAFIACVDAFQVRILDIAERRIVDSIDIPVVPADIPGLLSGPTLMTYDPDTDLLFVTTQFGNSVVAVRVATKDVVADIPLSTARPFGITKSDDGSRVYVACVNPLGSQGRVYVIDNTTTPPMKIDSLDVGNQSFGLIWRPL